MSFRVSNVADYDRFIAVDIGAFKIKVLICSVEEGSLRVIGDASVRQSRKNFASGEIADLYGVSETIKKAIAKASENIENVPKDVVFSLSSRNTLYDTIVMNYVREDKDAPIDMEEIDSIIKKIEYKSLERIKTKSESRIGVADSEMKLVTTSITSIVLDGQKLSNPIGFSGKNIKLGLLNIFVPVSEYNTLGNICRGLGKNLISIIPSYVTLPKLIEDGDAGFDFNLILDLGYSKTTLILENRGEIIGANTLNFGVYLLEEELKNREPDLSYLTIENILADGAKHYKKHQDSFDRFFSILFDGIFVATTDIAKQLYLKNIFLSGGGSSDLVQEKLREYLEEKSFGSHIHIGFLKSNDEDLANWNTPTYTQTLALAKTTQEMFLFKKDPIARLLRYILYRYE